MRAQHARALRAPGPVFFQILQHTAIGIVHAAMQHEFGGASLQLGKGDFVQQRNWIVIEFAPPGRIEIEK